MPWKEINLMDQRLEFAQRALTEHNERNTND
jgi:hypothetical protein